MKSLKDYIVQEGLLDNMFYLLDIWFGNNKQEYEEFTNICTQNVGTKSVSVDKIKKDLAGTELEKNLKSFVGFIQGDVKLPENTNYYYLFTKIVDNVIANQAKDNKYTKNKNAYDKKDIIPNEITNKDIVKTKPEDPAKTKQSPKNPKKFKDIASRKIEPLVPKEVEILNGRD